MIRSSSNGIGKEHLVIIQTVHAHLSLIRMIVLKPWAYSPNHHFMNAIGKVKNSLLATEATNMTVIYHLVHSPFQKIEMLSTGGPAQEMTCPENLSCGTLNTKEQFTSFQVPPVAVQNGESHRRPIGRGVLHQGSGQGRLFSKHQACAGRDLSSEQNKKDKGL